jgi:glutathione peroxidase
VTKPDGSTTDLSSHKGKVLLIVNTASKCGFTPQYKGLEQLYENLHGKGLEILGFPCNQFGAQEPGAAEEIESFCEINYGVTFPLFEKIDVNGKNTAPLYQHLKEAKPGLLGPGDQVELHQVPGRSLRQSGETLCPDKPEELTRDIEALL